jgi:ADP-ribose pyrophosphatase YjhB (NUDIX family)
VHFFHYCPDCGAALGLPNASSDRLVSQPCRSCGAVHFRNAKPCAGAVVVRDGRALLGRRAVEPARGRWDIPGGFLNPWEHPADGAIREVREETGLEIRLKELLSVVIDTYNDRDYTLNMYYLAEVALVRASRASDRPCLPTFCPRASGMAGLPNRAGTPLTLSHERKHFIRADSQIVGPPHVGGNAPQRSCEGYDRRCRFGTPPAPSMPTYS